MKKALFLFLTFVLPFTVFGCKNKSKSAPKQEETKQTSEKEEEKPKEEGFLPPMF